MWPPPEVEAQHTEHNRENKATKPNPSSVRIDPGRDIEGQHGRNTTGGPRDAGQSKSPRDPTPGLRTPAMRSPPPTVSLGPLSARNFLRWWRGSIYLKLHRSPACLELDVLRLGLVKAVEDEADDGDNANYENDGGTKHSPTPRRWTDTLLRGRLSAADSTRNFTVVSNFSRSGLPALA